LVLLYLHLFLSVYFRVLKRFINNKFLVAFFRPQICVPPENAVPYFVAVNSNIKGSELTERETARLDVR
jgi:hypothetical protein